MAMTSPDERIYNLNAYMPWRDTRPAKWLSYILFWCAFLVIPPFYMTQRLAATLIRQHQTYVGHPDLGRIYGPWNLPAWYLRVWSHWEHYPGAVTAIVTSQVIDFFVSCMFVVLLYTGTYWVLWFFMGRTVPDALGSGRLATNEEMEAAGVFHNDGVICGFKPVPVPLAERLRRLFARDLRGALRARDFRIVSAPAEHHTIVVGPSGEGKTQDVILQTEAAWEGPMFIYDYKGDQTEKLSGYLASEEGGRDLHVVCLGEPDKDDLRGVVGSQWEGAINPLDAIADFDDAKEIILALEEQAQGENRAHDDSAGNFFKTLARESLQAITTWQRLMYGDGANLGMTNDLIANQREDLIDQILRTPHNPEKEQRWFDHLTGRMSAQHPSIRTVMQKIDKSTEEQKTSIFNLASNYLSPWLDARVRRATSTTTFRYDAFLRALLPGERRPAVLLYSPYRRKNTNRPVVRSIVQTWLRRVIGADVNYYSGRDRCLLALDEVDSLGYIPALKDDINEWRSKGITAMLGVQGLNMLSDRYGANEPISMACRTQVFLRPLDDRTPGLLKSRTGEMNLRTLAAPSSSMKHYGQAYQDIGRDVFKDYEVRYIPRDRALVFMAEDVPGGAGLRPMYVHRTHAVHEPEFEYRITRPLPWKATAA